MTHLRRPSSGSGSNKGFVPKMEDRGYLQGVPFLLGKKFIPLPDPPQLSPIDIGPPPPSLEVDYNFDLERSTILATHSYYQDKERRALEAEERRKAAEEQRRLEAETEAIEREKELKLAYEEMRRKNAEDTSPTHIKANGHISNTSLETERIDSEGQGPITGTTAPGTTGPHLQSQPQFSNSIIVSTSSSAPHISPVPASSAPIQTPNFINQNHPRINLSDFESDTASRSPFDLVALKSLDDRRELASILGNMSLNNTNMSVTQHNSNTAQHAQALHSSSTINNQNHQNHQLQHQPAIQSYFRRDYHNPYHHQHQNQGYPCGPQVPIIDHRNSLYSMNLNSTVPPGGGTQVPILNPNPQIPMPLPIHMPLQTHIFGGTGPTSGGPTSGSSGQTIGSTTWPRFP